MHFHKIKSLEQSLEKNKVDKVIVDKIMKGAEKITSSTKPDIKAEWCYQAMTRMDELLEESLRQKIREDCACSIKGWRNDLCKKVNKNYGTAEERIKAVNEASSIFGDGVKIVGDGKYEVFFFDDSKEEFRCVCLRSLDKEWSETWCYCCGGHVKYHLETLLGKELKVKVVSSALMSNGRENCIFELE